MSRMSRRSVLGSSAALPVMGAAPTNSGPEADADADAALLSACAAFLQADAKQAVSNAKEGWNEGEINGISVRWYAALNAILVSAPPTTAAGKMALARAGQAALMDQVSGSDREVFHTKASREERLAAKALAAMASDSHPVFSPSGPEGSDTRLLALCAVFHKAGRAQHRVSKSGRKVDEDQAGCWARLTVAANLWMALMDQVANEPALTAAGLEAKALALQEAIKHPIIKWPDREDVDYFVHERLALSLVNDVVRARAGRASA